MSKTTIIEHVSPVQVRLVTIDPNLAAKMLESNTRNRPLNQAVVNRYAKEMKQGRWGIAEAAIAIDSNGAIINGQHRLWAVVESNTSIQSFLATGYPPEAMAYMDDAHARTTGVMYNITHGKSISTSGEAIAKVLLLGPSIKVKPSRASMFEVIEKHYDAIQFATELMGSRRSISVSHVAAVIARSYYLGENGRMLVRNFCRVLTTGQILEPRDKNPALLRDYLYRTSKNSADLRTEKYWKTERALQAYLNGEQLTKLVAASKELFPIP